MPPHIAPASTFARDFGVKALVYGPPGSGKTPVAATAPRPILCASEPGLLSLRGSSVAACQAFTPEAIDDFYKWLFGSKEAANYDTVCIDSVSQQAEILLTQELGRNKDGRKAYGEMSRRMMEHLNGLYYTRNKHTYLICKQSHTDTQPTEKVPYFPGKDLGVKVPHMYDEVLHLGLYNVPGVAGAVQAFRCHPSYDVRARDRSGTLAEYEPPHLTTLFNKIMRGPQV